MTGAPAPAATGKSIMAPITTPDQARELLERLARQTPPPYALRPPPGQRLGPLLARLDDPHRHLPVIHITGSKGKGSVALMVEAILEAAGLRTGTFTSPHLERWTERFRLEGREIGPDTFTTLMETLRPHLEAGESPGFFDTITAGALTLFRDRGVDYAVVEAGLGGRLDATNVVSPVMTCITAIEREHTAQLGPTLTAIAREKAGIVKPGVPLVSGRLPRAADRVVAARTRARSAPWLRLGEDITVTVSGRDDRGQDLEIGVGARKVTVRLPLAGVHQAHNAALAAACVARLDRLDPDLWAGAVSRGLGNVTLPGRIEYLSRRPWIVVDGAHTRASCRALAGALEALPIRHVRLLLSASGPEHLEAVCPVLLPLAGRVIVTRADPHRSLPAAAVEAHLRSHYPQLPLLALDDPRAALEAATRNLAADELLLAAGSVYLAGLTRSYLRTCTSPEHPVHPRPGEITP